MANIHREGLGTHRRNRAAAEKGNPIPFRQGQGRRPAGTWQRTPDRRAPPKRKRWARKKNHRLKLKAAGNLHITTPLFQGQPSPDGVPKENTTLTTPSLTNPQPILSFHSGKCPGVGGRVLSSTSREESDALQRRHCCGWTNQPRVSPGPGLAPPTPRYK